MASIYTKASTGPTTTAANHHHHHRNIRSSLTREDLLAMARNEYARQLCKFTEAQLKQRVPSCYTNSAYKRTAPGATRSTVTSSSHSSNNS
ncbi:hypothetical protein BJV82DRAFT_587590 [Fennellomyces sp. T-0311]|nr:hypothetical protein BJV82DRAFT_587590 [Fennellomyces sp. T-0311]